MKHVWHYELRKLGLNVETQAVVPVKYQDVFVETGLRLDLWVERKCDCGAQIS